MKKIDTIDFGNQKVLIRVDFNVPLDENFNVRDNTRIRAALPTIQKVLNDGGTAILMSHLGRPKDGFDKKFSLEHIVDELKSLASTPVHFATDCVGEEAMKVVEKAGQGEIVLLENLRFHKHEKMGTESFAEALSKLGDFYINDAFGTAHRAHASTSIIARFFGENKCFGYLMENEIESVNKILSEGKKPVTAILGGAKVSTKITIIEQLLPKIDNLIIGGGMIFSFVKAQGGKVGNSLVEDDKLQLSLDVLEMAKNHGVEVYIPKDAAVAEKFDNDAAKKLCAVGEIEDGWMGLDIGPESANEINEIIKNSSTILWNGPMGVFEFDNFADGTKQVGEAVCEATSEGAFSLVGGGDSVAAVNKFKMADQVSYVSTGGGALLEFLEGKELPGIAAMNN